MTVRLLMLCWSPPGWNVSIWWHVWKKRRNWNWSVLFWEQRVCYLCLIWNCFKKTVSKHFSLKNKGSSTTPAKWLRKVSEETIRKLKYFVKDLHPGHRSEQLTIKAPCAQAQIQSKTVINYRGPRFYSPPYLLLSDHEAKSWIQILFCGMTVTILYWDQRCYPGRCFRTIIHLSSAFWWLWVHAWCMCANVRRHVFA